MIVHAVANQLGIEIFTLTLSSCLLPREDPSKSSSYSCSLLFLGDCSTKVCSSSSLDWSRSAGGSSKLAVSPALLSGRVSSRRLAISESCSFAPLPNYQEKKSHFKLQNFCPWRLKHRVKNFTITQIRLTPFFLRLPLNAFPKKITSILGTGGLVPQHHCCGPWKQLWNAQNQYGGRAGRCYSNQDNVGKRINHRNSYATYQHLSVWKGSPGYIKQYRSVLVRNYDRLIIPFLKHTYISEFF